MPESLLERLDRTTDQIFSRAEFEAKLALGRPLRIKYGVDITAPFLHIGHAVNLWMMREMQEAGHRVVFLLGDFTTRIGDPTGRSAARKVPAPDEIERNAEAFLSQCGQVLLTDPEVFEVRRNSEWFDVMGTSQFLELLSLVTHGRLIQRDMFQQRISAQKEIYMHELLYPILQGYDSYMLESDLTIVGSDQLFNEMMGRTYQERFGQAPQVVMTSRITPGTDGVNKQSKTLGNYIALADTPRDKFGKLMSIPDTLIKDYLEVYTTVPLPEVAAQLKRMAEGGNPRDAKGLLASAVVARYHGEAAAAAERDWFATTFSQRQAPDDVPEWRAPASLSLLDALTQGLEAALGETVSRSEARRLLKQGAVSLAGERLSLQDEASSLGVLRERLASAEASPLLKVGKRRWLKWLPEDA